MKKIFGKLPLTKRIVALVLIAAAVTGTATAAFLANFVVPTTVNITGTPGISVVDSNGNVLTALTWGDVQQTTSSTKVVMLKNVGQSTAWFLDGSVTSLSTNPSLPTGITLSWNLAQTYGIQQCSAAGASGITGCVPLGPGQISTQLTLTLSVSTAAALGSASWNTVFNAYSTATG